MLGGVEEEYVKPNIVAALREVKNLQRGELGTFDNPPREDVSDEVVKRTLPFMSPTVAAMVQLQRITGMRPSEVYRMTVGDIDRSKEQDGLWHYILKTHKTEKRVGAGKVIPLGKPEQILIGSYLVSKAATESVFSPRQAVQGSKLNLRKLCQREMVNSVASMTILTLFDVFDATGKTETLINRFKTLIFCWKPFPHHCLKEN